MKIKNYLVIGAILILLTIFALSAKNIIASSNTQTNTQDQTVFSTNQAPTQTNHVVTQTANQPNQAATNIQNAKLSLVDFSYKLEPNKIIKGVPVRIVVDAATLSGCMKNIVIRDFGIQKTITPTNNIIEFTPDKTGTFWITCSMGMGPGSFEVVNPDGTSDTTAKTTQTQSPPTKASGGSCGMDGGCGCMG